MSKTQPWARVYLSISFYSHSRVHFFRIRMRWCRSVWVSEWVLVSLEWQLHNRIIMIAKCEFRYNCGMNFSNSMQQSLKVSFLWGGVISCYCQTTTWNIQIVLLLPTIFHCCNCFHTSNYITVCNRCWIYRTYTMIVWFLTNLVDTKLVTFQCVLSVEWLKDFTEKSSTGWNGQLYKLTIMDNLEWWVMSKCYCTWRWMNDN